MVSRAGGMGGPAALMLTMAGVGRLILAHGGEAGGHGEAFSSEGTGEAVIAPLSPMTRPGLPAVPVMVSPSEAWMVTPSSSTG